MDKYYVLVAGNGATSRANLEALMEDHYYSKGPEGTLIVAFKDKPTQSQIFAIQYSMDKKKEILIYTSEGADFTGLKNSDAVFTETPLEDAVQHLKGEDASVFLLWSDEDPDCTNALAAAKSAKLPVFDLTDGLNPINAVKNVKPIEETKFPVQEMSVPMPAPVEEVEEEDEEEVEEEEDSQEPLSAETEDDDDDSDGQDSSDLFFGIQAIAKIMAPIFAEALVEALKNGSKGGLA
jgi:hypothetical protein